MRIRPRILWLLLPTAIPLLAADPSWWVARGVKTETPSANLAPATVGQAKHMAAMALAELESQLPPATLQALRADVQAVVDLNVPDPLPPGYYDKQRAVLLNGQLKAMAKPFYDHLRAYHPAWLDNAMIAGNLEVMEPGSHPPQRSPYPWSEHASDDANRAPATLGQLKAVFSFPFQEDVDVNGTSDLNQNQNQNQNQNTNNSQVDTDGDGLTDQEEIELRTRTDKKDTDDDGIDDLNDGWPRCVHVAPPRLSRPQYAVVKIKEAAQQGQLAHAKEINNRAQALFGFRKPSDGTSQYYYLNGVDSSGEFQCIALPTTYVDQQGTTRNHDGASFYGLNEAGHMIVSRHGAGSSIYQNGQLVKSIAFPEDRFADLRNIDTRYAYMPPAPSILLPTKKWDAVVVDMNGIVEGYASKTDPNYQGQSYADQFGRYTWMLDNTIKSQHKPVVSWFDVHGGAGGMMNLYTYDNSITGGIIEIDLGGEMTGVYASNELGLALASQFNNKSWSGYGKYVDGVYRLEYVTGGELTSTWGIYVNGKYIPMQPTKSDGNGTHINHKNTILKQEGSQVTLWVDQRAGIRNDGVVDGRPTKANLKDFVWNPVWGEAPPIRLNTQMRGFDETRIWQNGQWLAINELISPPPSPQGSAPQWSDIVIADMNDHGTCLASATNAEGKSCAVFLLPVEVIPDYNRDGKIDQADRGKITTENPWRWWVNDDDDVDSATGGDVPNSNSPNHQDYVINGLRDLVDFFPLHLGLEQALKSFPKDEYKYLVKHADGAVKFHEITETVLDDDPENNGPGAYLRNLTKAKSLASSSVKWATSSGVNLSGEILDAFAAGKGIIICESTKETSKPLVIEIRKNDGTSIAEIEFPVKFSGVEKMYRHGNMRNQVGGGSGGLATQLNDPGAPYPDSLTNGKYFVFLHGFKVSADAARGWHAEIFKRLHQLGSRARFLGISWHGDVSPDYHKAVKHAFVTSEQLASWLQVPGEITIAAHSLGNMIVSNAIEHEGLNVKRYFMINAATPIEAYDANQKNGVDGTEMEPRMTENDWKDYDRKLYSGNWHELFTSNPSDGRNKLTWANRFASKVPAVAYNFYSTGEDVVENADPTERFIGNIVRHGFVRHAWVQQEIAKGNPAAVPVALKDTHAGWDFHFRYVVHTPTFPQTPVGYFKWGPNSAGQNVTYRYEPAEAALLTPEQLKTKPFHWPFKYSDIYDPAKGSAEAAQQFVQQDLLAAAIPAMSYAAAANSVNKFTQARNFDMMNQKNGGWPRQSGDWHHSDFRDVALSYVLPMYQKMIDQGELNQ